MKALVLAFAVVAATASLASAFECPTLQQQIDAAFSNRADGAAAQARALAAEAWALHQAGKHAESVAKYDEAAKAGGIKLTHKK